MNLRELVEDAPALERIKTLRRDCQQIADEKVQVIYVFFYFFNDLFAHTGLLVRATPVLCRLLPVAAKL